MAGAVKAVLTPVEYLKLSPGQQAAVRRWVELHGFTHDTVAHIRVVDNLAELVVVEWDPDLRQVSHQLELVDLRAEFPIR